LKEKKIDKSIFNKELIDFSLVCYSDLIGISTDGSIFDFYKYKINDSIIIKENGKYPNFDLIFTQKLVNVESLYWQNTPMANEKDHSPTQIAFYGNLRHDKDASLFFQKNYLNNKGAYYSYISAYPIGIYLFVYSPSEKLLYVIHKKK
jgi:hypothetical protein